MKSHVKVDLTRMRALGAALHQARSARVRVGILGNKAERFDDEWNKEAKNNPTIGLEHEFGLKGDGDKPPLPARSFLRMPLNTQLPRQIDQIGKAAWKSLILKTSVVDALTKLGIIAENIIQRAFETGGFGQWAPLAPYTLKLRRMRKFKGTAILIVSAQLRKSISSIVHMGKAKP